jgi:hypothetical protein
MGYDFWAELVSPLKSDFRNAFYQYAGEVYRSRGIALTAYLPAAMGGDMLSEDYLTYLPESELPECLLAMGFGECSSLEFARRILSGGIYEQIETAAFFPELMVADLERLGSRPVPENYEDLADEAYFGEISIIGNPKLPDPTAALYLYRKLGRDALVQFARNIHAFAAPVDTIRHIGKKSNNFASIFIMPSLFAFVCKEKTGAKVIIPPKGAAAEPILFMSKNASEKSRLIRSFLYSEPVRKLFAEKCFPMAGDEFLSIDPVCKKTCICEELEEVFSILRENLIHFR